MRDELRAEFVLLWSLAFVWYCIELDVPRTHWEEICEGTDLAERVGGGEGEIVEPAEIVLKSESISSTLQIRVETNTIGVMVVVCVTWTYELQK